eukprot:TCONS_00054787-protein
MIFGKALSHCKINQLYCPRNLLKFFIVYLGCIAEKMRQFHPDMLFSKTQVRINNRKNSLYITQMQTRIHNLREDLRKNELLRQNERRQIENIRHQMKMQIQGYKDISFPCISTKTQHLHHLECFSDANDFKSVRRARLPSLPTKHRFKLDQSLIIEENKHKEYSPDLTVNKLTSKYHQ